MQDKQIKESKCVQIFPAIFIHLNVNVGKRLHIYIFYQGSAAVAISSY